MLRYIISISLFFAGCSLMAQTSDTAKDSVAYKDRYGIRVGLDVVLPFYTALSDETKGFEIVSDFRVSKRFYAATELGYRDYSGEEDFYKYTTSGQYIKAGVDYNAYKNWIGMENMIVVGLRYAFSTFDQTVNEYTINADPFIPGRTESETLVYDNLNAQWIELVLGLKVEVLHNVFLGVSFRGNKMISSSEPDNFKNLYVPGFGSVSFNNAGFSFNYTVSYLIPIFKK